MERVEAYYKISEKDYAEVVKTLINEVGWSRAFDVLVPEQLMAVFGKEWVEYVYGREDWTREPYSKFGGIIITNNWQFNKDYAKSQFEKKYSRV